MRMRLSAPARRSRSPRRSTHCRQVASSSSLMRSAASSAARPSRSARTSVMCTMSETSTGVIVVPRDRKTAGGFLHEPPSTEGQVQAQQRVLVVEVGLKQRLYPRQALVERLTLEVKRPCRLGLAPAVGAEG